jgi:hypothetical protein
MVRRRCALRPQGRWTRLRSGSLEWRRGRFYPSHGLYIRGLRLSRCRRLLLNGPRRGLCVRLIAGGQGSGVLRKRPRGRGVAWDSRSDGHPRFFQTRRALDGRGLARRHRHRRRPLRNGERARQNRLDRTGTGRDRPPLGRFLRHCQLKRFVGRNLDRRLGTYGRFQLPIHGDPVRRRRIESHRRRRRFRKHGRQQRDPHGGRQIRVIGVLRLGRRYRRLLVWNLYQQLEESASRSGRRQLRGERCQ